MMINKILIGIDDSKYAEHAAEYAFNIAHKFNAAVGVVNIVEPAMMPQAPSVADPIMGVPLQGMGINEMEILEIKKNQSNGIIDRTLKKFEGENIQITHFSEYGSTADGIIHCSKEYGADLIVIGTHNRSGLDRLLMGSVAEHVVRHSEIPVLVVPFKEKEDL